MTDLALYGNARIPRTRCPQCGDVAFVVDREMTCCGLPVPKLEVVRSKRICEPEAVRRQPSAEAQRRLLEETNGCCAYCDRLLGSYVTFRGRSILLRLHWDHNVPYAYGQDNRDENFLPACHKCNGWKSARVFPTLDAIRVFVAARWSGDDDA